MSGHLRRRQGAKGEAWQALVYAGTDPTTGRKRYVSRSAPTRDEAEAARDQLLREVEATRVAAAPAPAKRPAEWAHRGACRDVAGVDFFPEHGASPAPALAVCARCPVSEACRSYALSDRSIVGVWGATTERDRRQMRRRAALPAVS